MTSVQSLFSPTSLVHRAVLGHYGVAEFPDRFASVEQARAFCREFFSWYNNEHRHSGIGLLTPAMVHHGMADQITARLAEVLANAYAHHPERFKRGRPRPRTIDPNVWINRPDDTP